MSPQRLCCIPHKTEATTQGVIMGRMKAAADGAEDSSPACVVPDLTPAQKVARMGGLGGSDAERIMAGNWYRLWAEKTKRVAAEDLTRVLPVQMGKVTEAFNA